MEPRITLVTLGVADLARSVRFYRDGLGWPTTYDPDSPPVAFFGTAGARLALFGLEDLAADVAPEFPVGRPGAGGVTLAHNVRSREEVADVLALSERAGARVLKPAQAASWGGHTGYFADPDGHLWEVAWNPFLPLDDDGTMQLAPVEAS